MWNVIISIIIGAVGGWLAGELVKGRGFGLTGNIVVGIIGGLVGQFLLEPLGLEAGNWLGSILVATFGATVMIVLINIIKKD